MKKCLTWLLALCLTAAALCPGLAPEAEAAGVSVWDGTAATEFAGGKGTQSKPYLIETAQQLAYLAQSVNGGTDYYGEYISLQADLDLSRLPWTPIGNGSNAPFCGTFSGNAYTISNLYINAPSADNQGLFGYCGFRSVIQNLRLLNISVTGKANIGGVTGCAYGATIQDCNVSGSISGAKNVGGLVGYGGMAGYSSGSVSRCINNATVLANQNCAGGIVGYHGDEGYLSSISLCVNHGAVDSYGDCVGGISGMGHAIISSCLNTGAIGGNATSSVGGISAIGGFVTNCANMGTVTSKGSADGVSIGSAYGVSRHATNCYNIGTVSTSSKFEDSYSVAEGGANRYTLRSVAEELDEKDGNGLTILDEMNTPAFAATLNRNIEEGDSTWLQDASVYGGFPYFEPRTVSGIAVTTPPAKTIYAPGDTFDPSSMVVTAKCTDGSSYELSHNKLTFFPSTPLTEGSDSVTVFYGTMNVTYPVTVSAKSVPSYEIASIALKNESGSALSAIPAGDFLATVAMKRLAGNDGGLVMLASYTAAGKFRGLKYAYAPTETPVGVTAYVTISVDNPSGDIASVRAFLISSFEDLRPVGDPVSFPAA